MEKKTLYIITATPHIDKRSARIHSRVLTVISSRVGNDDPGMYKMELSFVSRNSHSEIWKEEKLFRWTVCETNSASGRNQKWAPPSQRAGHFSCPGSWSVHFYANESKLHSSDRIGPNSMVPIRQGCVLLLACIEAKEE